MEATNVLGDKMFLGTLFFFSKLRVMYQVAVIIIA
jgi:hypothetical protein